MYTHIMIAVDGSSESLQAVREALKLIARGLRTEIALVSGESVSEVPPASIQVEVARLHAPRRNAGRQTRYRAAPTIHANPFHVLAEAA